jgi:hypothetical protein
MHQSNQTTPLTNKMLRQRILLTVEPTVLAKQQTMLRKTIQSLRMTDLMTQSRLPHVLSMKRNVAKLDCRLPNRDPMHHIESLQQSLVTLLVTAR